MCKKSLRFVIRHHRRLLEQHFGFFPLIGVFFKSSQKDQSETISAIEFQPFFKGQGTFLCVASSKLNRSNQMFAGFFEFVFADNYRREIAMSISKLGNFSSADSNALSAA